MEWDPELARVAQRHADQCTFDHDCAECRSVDRWGVGQNLYIYKQSLRLPQTNWKRAVTDWYDEVRLFNRKHVQPFQFRAAIGHFSQLVWADTYKVGCGATSYREGKWFSTLYTCNYGPNGNFIRSKMYKQGRSCSACPANSSCSASYPGLCARTSVAPQFLPSPVTNTTTTTTQSPTTRRTTRKTTTRRTTTRRTTRKTTRRTTTRRTTSDAVCPWPGTSICSTSARRSTQRPPRRRTTTQRTTRSTTTPSSTTTDSRFPNSTLHSMLFSCDFQDPSVCTVRSTGVDWQRVETRQGNVYYQTDLAFREKTELFFKNTITPPDVGIACLDFKYRKFSKGGRKTSLQVVAWPYKGKPGKISVFRDSPSATAWVRAQITFRHIDNVFLVMFRAGGPTTKGDKLHLAIDQVAVLPGKCGVQ